MPKEEDFKRGGVEKVARKRKTDNDLFKVGGKEGQVVKKKRMNFKTKEERIAQKKAKMKAQKKEEVIFQPNVEKASILSSKVLTDGMLLYGIVKQIHDYEIDVSLPNGLTGTLPISNICSSYTALLHRLTEEGVESIDEEVCGLNELFRVGQPVRCKLLDTGSSVKGAKKPKLTIDPRAVNENLIANNLKPSLTLCGAVASVEDRGYIIDLGIKGVKAFLTLDDAESCIQNAFVGKLGVGSHIHCSVKSDNSATKSRSINVTIDPSQVFRQEISKSAKITVQSLQPGMSFLATVEKVNRDGLNVKFLDYNGNIHKSHLEKAPDKYEEGAQIKATVLFIHPMTKFIAMSALPHLLTPDLAPKVPFGDLTVGTIIENAETLHVDGKRGVVFKLSGKIKGYAFRKQLSDKETDNITDKFPKTSIHRCRITDFDYVDNVAVVTLKESILSRPFLKYSDIEPGMVVEGTVKNLVNGGVVVLLGNYIQGFMPSMHLADIPLKHPEKFYEPGGKVRCKVLTMDPNAKRLILTGKKSLINTKLPTITSYNDCQRGMLVEGFIGDVKPHGVLVVFYNNVKGWVPKPELSSKTIEFPQKVFFKGQVVKSQVLATNPELEKIILTLKVSGKTSFGSQTRELPEDFAVGKIFKAKIVEKTNIGLDVEDTKSQIKVFIPKEHLSDHRTNCDGMLKMYHKGQVIQGAVYLSVNGNVVTATRRPTFYKRAKSKEFITEFSDLKPGLMLTGSVRKVMDYGVFVDVGGGLVGLAPNQFLCDQRLPKPSSAFSQGQAVIGNVTEVDYERKRFLVSLRMTDCYHGDTDIGIELLQDFLKEDSLIRESILKLKDTPENLKSYKVGQLVKATVENVNDAGVLCLLENGVKGIVTSDHLGGATCEVGKKLQGVVLHPDLKSKCLEMSFDTKLVAAVKNFQDNKFSEVKIDQVIKSEVQLIKEDFVLVSLRGHCSGRFAYLPAKRHLNDILERHQYIIGQVNTIVIKEVEDSYVLASLQLHEKITAAVKQETRDVKQPKLKPGAIADGVVLAVHKFELKISVSGWTGHVHISEVEDEPQEGSNPLIKFHQEQAIKVKVIGSRKIEVNKKKPKAGRLSQFKRTECSLKKSLLETEGIPSMDKKYNVGDKVHFFVTGFHGNFIHGSLSPTMTGKVHVLNCSTDEAVVKEPSKKFHRACCYFGHVLSVQGGFLDVSFLGPNSKIEAGNVVQGYVISKKPGLGVIVKLADGLTGPVALCDMSDSYEDLPTEKYFEGQCIRCYILQLGDSKKRVALSMRNSRLSSDSSDVTDKELNTMDSIKEGKIYRGYVSNTSVHGVFVSLSREISGRVMFENVADCVLKKPEQVFYPGKVVTVKVIRIDPDTHRINLSMLERDTHVEQEIPAKNILQKRRRKTSESTETKTNKKRKVQKTKEVEVKDVVETEESEDEVQIFDTSSSKEVARLSLGSDFCWDDDFKLPRGSVNQATASDSDSGDDSDDDAGKPKPKRTRQEKKQLQEEEEKLLSQKEKLLLDSNRAPEAADDFDRLVIQSPNSSIVWMRYMAFYLETAEVEKAKAVAERALKTMSFREEQEKFNVWVAYLNLENMYGTQKSLSELFDRAIKHNDPLKMHQQLITIYIHSGKTEAAEQLHNVVVKRFHHSKDVWISFGQFYFHQNKIDQARKLMQRSLKTLDRKNHVDVLSKFAQLEYKMGEPERGKTMFENILSSYPKRTDLWSIYIDMTIKQADLADVRQLFERVIHMSFSAKKMKFFFKKYLDFEDKFGTEENVSAIKQKAVEYVQSKAEVDVE